MSQTLPTSPALPPTTRARLAAVDHAVTHDEWIADWATREEKYELVDGIPLVSPQEQPRNYSATSRLMIRLVAALGDEWEYHQGSAIEIARGARLTYRAPDLTLLRPTADLVNNPLDPRDVVLIAETLSPSTREDDLGRKRRDYASVGILHYLIIDRDRTPRLTLLTNLADGDYRTEEAGERLTLRIAGHDIVVDAPDIIR